MMDQAIQDFPKQFLFHPRVIGRVPRLKKFVVLGMGGSNLTAGLLKMVKPELDVVVHKDYGLPTLASADLRKRLIVAVSYSGNTEETVDGFLEARKQHLPTAVIATGGKLLALAKQHRVPYIELPITGIQPRMATGFQFLSLAKLMGLASSTRASRVLADTLNPSALRTSGKALAKKFHGQVPVIYTSIRNQPIAYHWKITMNETGKIPAFANVFSELNHNEMTGFDVKSSSRELSRRLHFVFLEDAADHPRVTKRLRFTEKLYRSRGLAVTRVLLHGKNPLHKIFSSLLLADWTAYHLARHYHLEPEAVPMVEEFKKLL